MKKKFVSVFITSWTLVLVSFASAQSETIQVPNSSFENLTENGEPVSWLLSPRHPRSVTKVVDKPGGKGHCLYMKASKEAAKGTSAGNCDATSDKFSIEPKASCLLSLAMSGTA